MAKRPDDQLAPADILKHALRIAKPYDGNLTLRQLYYQLVANRRDPWDSSSPGIIENCQESYKRLVSLLGKARMDGAFPFDWLVDRGRDAGESKYSRNNMSADMDSVAAMIRKIPTYFIGRDRWFSQSVYVSVWVEKEALAGVFEEPCERRGIGLFAKELAAIGFEVSWLETYPEQIEVRRKPSAKSPEEALEESKVIGHLLTEAGVPATHTVLSGVQWLIDAWTLSEKERQEAKLDRLIGEKCDASSLQK